MVWPSNPRKETRIILLRYSMDIKCIALDLDRTTLNQDGRLSDGNRMALEYAISKGVHIVIASGRGFASLPKDVVSIPGIEYAITSNGASVYHIPSGNRLMSYYMEPQSVRDILNLTAGRPIAYEAFIAGIAYAEEDYVQNPAKYGVANATQYIQSTRKPVPNFPNFMLEHSHELESIDLVVRSEEEKANLWALLQARVPDIYITSSVSQLLELSHRDAGKHSGVRFVAKQLDLIPAQIAAFGDGDNDADMLSYVGCGIAVANASPACLAAADQITTHHREDGVAYGIYHILHI